MGKKEKSSRKRRSNKDASSSSSIADDAGGDVVVPSSNSTPTSVPVRDRLEELRLAVKAARDDRLASRTSLSELASASDLPEGVQSYVDRLEALVDKESQALEAYSTALFRFEDVLIEREFKALGISSRARLDDLNAMPPPVVKRAQGFAQSWIMRRRWRSLAKQAASATSGPLHKLYKRSKVLKEIMSTEMAFFASLRTLNETYYFVLRDMLSAQEMNDAFLYQEVQSITTMSKTFLTMYRNRLAEWPANGVVSDLFITLVPMLKVYEKFCVKWESALSLKKALLNPASSPNGSETIKRKDKTMKVALDKARKLQKVMEEVKQNQAHGNDISHFLIQPVQRLPRYRMFLEELIKCTPECHIDRAGLVEAGLKMGEMVSYIDDRKTHAERKELFNSLLLSQSVDNKAFSATGGPHSGAGIIVKVNGGANLPSELSLSLYLRVGNQKVWCPLSKKESDVRINRDYAFRCGVGEDSSSTDLTVLLCEKGKKTKKAVGNELVVPLHAIRETHSDASVMSTWFSLSEDKHFPTTRPAGYGEPMVSLGFKVVVGDARTTIRAGARPSASSAPGTEDSVGGDESSSSMGGRTPRTPRASEDSETSSSAGGSHSLRSSAVVVDEDRHENPLFQLKESDPEEWAKLDRRMRRRLAKRCRSVGDPAQHLSPTLGGAGGSPTKKGATKDLNDGSSPSKRKERKTRRSALKSGRRLRSTTMDYPPQPNMRSIDSMSVDDSETSDEEARKSAAARELAEHNLEPLSVRSKKGGTHSSSSLSFGSKSHRQIADDGSSRRSNPLGKSSSKRASMDTLDVDSLNSSFEEMSAMEEHAKTRKHKGAHYGTLRRGGKMYKKAGKSKRKKRSSTRSEATTTEASEDQSSELRKHSNEGFDSSLEALATRSSIGQEFMEGRE